MADTTMSVPRPRVNGTGGLTLSSRSLQLLELISVLDTRTVQGCSHQYDWSGFNRTTFRDNNHISANILEFGGMSGRPVGSHVATVDRVQISRRDTGGCTWLTSFPGHLLLPYLMANAVQRSPMWSRKGSGRWSGNEASVSPVPMCNLEVMHASTLPTYAAICYL